jgi:DNA-binding transcriptional LysR family regulator
LPPALAAFQKAVPRVEVLLHDLPSDELIAGLHNATLELALMVQPAGEQAAGIEFEVLRAYPPCVAPQRRLNLSFASGYAKSGLVSIGEDPLDSSPKNSQISVQSGT